MKRREIFFQTIVAIVSMNLGCRPDEALEYIETIKRNLGTSYSGATRFLLSLTRLE